MSASYFSITASGYLMLEMMFVRGFLSGPASPHWPNGGVRGTRGLVVEVLECAMTKLHI